MLNGSKLGCGLNEKILRQMLVIMVLIFSNDACVALGRQPRAISLKGPFTFLISLNLNMQAFKEAPSFETPISIQL